MVFSFQDEQTYLLAHFNLFDKPQINERLDDSMNRGVSQSCFLGDSTQVEELLWAVQKMLNYPCLSSGRENSLEQFLHVL
jgi:hypothetical protein